MRKNYVGKPFTRSAKEQEEDAKRIILDDLKDAIEDLKIEYPNQRGYLESVLREGELIASKIVRAERKTVNEIIDNREHGLNRLNDDMLKLNINGYLFNNEDKFKEEIIWHIAFNDTRSDFIKYPMREIAIKYFYMPVLKDEARRRGIKPDSRVGQARKSKRSHRLRGFHDEWYVVIEKNLPRRTSRMIDYDYGEENMYDNVVMKILDWAYDNNDKALIKSLNNLKNSKDFVKRTGSKIPYGYSTDIYGDKEWEILEVSKENFEELGEEYPDIYDRFKDDFDEEDIDY
ncbi:hypothetical protein [uncultured Barnesiella sp.]|jgi:hypothetical protein|uniref:hypothetical protein n=1 Tax=Barnesiella intestinihominis TaxID=487174 RepID=UPI002596EB7F|nr:hypothetical protein [uncultured Barnesiella sp.]